MFNSDNTGRQPPKSLDTGRIQQTQAATQLHMPLTHLGSTFPQKEGRASPSEGRGKEESQV